MAVTTYGPYNVSATLNNLLAIDALDAEIRANVVIATDIDGVNYTEGDSIFTVDFAAVLPAAEEAELINVSIPAHTGVPIPEERVIALTLPWEPDEPNTTIVIANGFLAIEAANGATAFASSQLVWPEVLDPNAQICVRASFILKAAGTGSNVRFAAEFKSVAVSGDSSNAFSPKGFVVVPVNFATVGEVFIAELKLYASGFALQDAVGVHVGRDGANTMGAGTNDDVNQPIQLIAVQVVGVF